MCIARPMGLVVEGSRIFFIKVGLIISILGGLVGLVSQLARSACWADQPAGNNLVSITVTR